MTIQRMHQDESHATFSISGQEVIDKLGRDYPIHISTEITPYLAIWKPLNITFIDNRGNLSHDIPDLSMIWGHLFLNHTAYTILNKILSKHGEFLPVNYGSEKGYIFNPLKVAEKMGALNKKLTTYDEYGNLEHFCFDERKIKNTPIFKSEIDTHGLFCTDELITTIKKFKLLGVYFHPDVSNSTGETYLTDH